MISKIPSVLKISKTTNQGMLFLCAAFQSAIPFHVNDQSINNTTTNPPMAEAINVTKLSEVILILSNYLHINIFTSKYTLESTETPNNTKINQNIFFNPSPKAFSFIATLSTTRIRKNMARIIVKPQPHQVKTVIQ